MKNYDETLLERKNVTKIMGIIIGIIAISIEAIFIYRLIADQICTSEMIYYILVSSLLAIVAGAFVLFLCHVIMDIIVYDKRFAALDNACDEFYNRYPRRRIQINEPTHNVALVEKYNYNNCNISYNILNNRGEFLFDEWMPNIKPINDPALPDILFAVYKTYDTENIEKNQCNFITKQTIDLWDPNSLLLYSFDKMSDKKMAIWPVTDYDISGHKELSSKYKSLGKAYLKICTGSFSAFVDAQHRPWSFKPIKSNPDHGLFVQIDYDYAKEPTTWFYEGMSYLNYDCKWTPITEKTYNGLLNDYIKTL